jgi:hypothetical protein
VFPLRAETVLLLGQVKAEVFDSILANLSLLPRDFVSCFTYRRKEESCPFHIVLSSWSTQQEVIYILEENAAMLVN